MALDVSAGFLIPALTALGQVLDERDWRRAAPLARTTLRGREDWTKHFFVSAALTVLSAQAPSDAIGVFKEELDAGGVSGPTTA